jgi:hypothetical protein
MLHAALTRKGVAENARAMARSFGADTGLSNAEADAELHRLHTEAALLATRHVVELAEQFTQSSGKKLLLILSFSRRSVASALKGETPFDLSFLDWVNTRETPVIDLRESFLEDYANASASVEMYLDRYFIGHHTPAGNFFFSWAIKERICDWLNPKPIPYL